MAIKRGDNVKVMVGKDRGKTGKVIRVDKCNQRVWVEGVNMVKKHSRATQQHRQSGIVDKESPINLSNVMYYDENSGKTSRLGFRLNKEGKKVRYLKRTDEVLG
ncbi:MAG: 50S ribosomal protein L24 [Pseudomonadota bacterium]